MGKPLNKQSDEELMMLITQKHHPAFSELVTRHTSRFYALAYRTIHDKSASEDIVQEAFLKLWQDPLHWNPNKGVKFTTWFYSVILNLCLDYSRRKKPFVRPETTEISDDTSCLDTKLRVEQQQQFIDKAIMGLPESQRTALNLCFYGKSSNQEAANIMGISLKALQSLLIRAKTTLREQVSEAVKGGE